MHEKRCRDGVICRDGAIHLVSVVFGTAIPTSLNIFGICLEENEE